MGWFDEQIRQRKQNDQDVFEDSIFRMASAIIGSTAADKIHDIRFITKAAIDEVLKYYHIKAQDISVDTDDPEEALELSLRPYGIMHRNVKLNKGWYKDAYGPMIGFIGDKPVALMPGKISGYTFSDADTGVMTKVGKHNEEMFLGDAICFYKPLPLRPVGISDFLLYLKGCLSMSDVVLYVVFSFLAVLITMTIPHITKLVTGFILHTNKNSLLLGTALLLISASGTSYIIRMSNELMKARIQTKASLSVEAAVMMRVMSLPAGFFKKYSSGELAKKCDSINSLCELLIGQVFAVSLSSVLSLLYITQIYGFAPSLAVPAIVVILATVLLAAVTAIMQMGISRNIMEFQAKENGVSFALLSGIQKIKLSGAEKRAFSKWAESYTKSADIRYNPPFVLKINEALTLLITLTGTIVIYNLAVRNNVGVSSYVAFSTAFGMAMGAFGSLETIALSCAQIQPILGIAKPILEAEPENTAEKRIISEITGSIELSGVYFRYDESLPYVLDDINIKIKPGEYVAVVGKTGCGKSTLMRILLGFETPERGAVYYDRMDLNGIDLSSLRRRIGTVTQDGGLFQGDIFSNIAIASPQMTLEDAWEAAEIAGIADDIREMPMGMHTMIAEGQGGFSGGQKQRLMIARAIGPKPRVLMFDEATSALDNKTQRQVSEALDKMGCTRIVIAHRLSTIKNCDRILVLDKGKIAEEGTYDELLQKEGLFAELVKRQRV